VKLSSFIPAFAMSESEPKVPPYSHDAAVAAITSYMKLLSRAYFSYHKPKLLYPPRRGWPEINAQDFACFRATKEALELRRHIPYFKWHTDVQLMPEVDVTSYIWPISVARWSKESCKMRQGELVAEPGCPPHIVCLGGSNEEYQSWVLVDTKSNVVIYENSHNEPPPLGLSFESQVSIPDEEYSALSIEPGKFRWIWPLPNFFEACERNLNDFIWMPNVSDVGDHELVANTEQTTEAEQYEEVRRIMRNAGWPGEHYDKKRAEPEARTKFDWLNEDEDEGEESEDENIVETLEGGLADLSMNHM
jgi:hypothetical protein